MSGAGQRPPHRLAPFSASKSRKQHERWGHHQFENSSIMLPPDLHCCFYRHKDASAGTVITSSCAHQPWANTADSGSAAVFSTKLGKSLSHSNHSKLSHKTAIGRNKLGDNGGEKSSAFGFDAADKKPCRNICGRFTATNDCLSPSVMGGDRHSLNPRKAR